MKKLLKILTLVFCVSMLCTLIACGNNEGGNNKPSANPNVVAIAGDYLIDGTDYGMPMKWYLKIGADEQFKISTKRDFSVDKGNGRVAESNGNFMLVYSDSTTESPKNCSFKVENGNLAFEGKVYVGAASVSSEETVLVLTLANESILGEYVGTLEKTNAMTHSTTYYNQSLTLKAGNFFRFESEFSMGGTYLYAEEGTFSVNGTALTLKALKKVTAANIETGELTDIATPSEEVGTLANGEITINVFPSPMSGSKSETTLQKATTSEYAGCYTGSKFIAMMSATYEAELILDKVGGYELYVNEYQEEGTFAVNENVITLTATSASYDDEPQDAPAAYELTLGTLSISGKVPTGGPKTQMTLYHEAVQGYFMADDSDNTPENYELASLELYDNGTFDLMAGVKDGDTPTLKVTLTGTFEVSAGMGGTTITLNVTKENGADVEYSLSGIVGTTLNIQDVPTDTEGNTCDFGFEATELK